MTRNQSDTAVSNNSWGHRQGAGFDRAPTLWELAIDVGVSTGFGGKGIFYAFAGGGGAAAGDNSNLSEYSNYYGVTAVCAVNDLGRRSAYSEQGANLWLCAPSSDSSLKSARRLPPPTTTIDIPKTSAAPPRPPP